MSDYAEDKKSPAFQFYASDFIGSSKVQRMPLAERGAYITLLAFAWLDHGLPTDMAELGRMVGLTKAAFTKMWGSQIHKCFVERSGKFVNLRQEDIRKSQAEYRKRQRENAAKGWQSRGNAMASERHMPNGCSPTPSPTPSPVKTHTEDHEPDAPFAPSAEAPSHPFPRWLTEWHVAYPESRRVSVRHVEQAFVSAFFRHADAPPLLFGRMMTALEAHKASAEWGRGVIPGMVKWLNEDWWLRTLTPPKDVPSRGDRTGGNVDAIQSFLDRKRAANDE